MRAILLIPLLGVLLLPLACAQDDYSLDDQAQHSITRIHTEKKYFRDEYDRYLLLHGANVSGSTKLPATVAPDPVSYVGRPFALEDADWNFRMLRDMGFNFIRMLVIWEGVEPDAPGVYDEEYLDYIAQIVAKANEYGIYVMLDMHQDFFSRWLRKYFVDDSGHNALLELPGLEDFAAPEYNDSVQGDGAPEWAVQLCLPDKNVGGPQWGLPRSVVNDPSQTTDVLPLHWGINLFLSVDVTRSFATFFAGREIYPNYTVDGKNVQDFLQDSYEQAWLQIVERVKDYPNVLAYDVMNEPVGLFFMFTLYALLAQNIQASPTGELSDDQVADQVDIALDELKQVGMPLYQRQMYRALLLDEMSLPRNADQLSAAGFPLDPAGNNPYAPDLTGAFNINVNFNRNYLQPFLSKVGQAIQAADPDAIVLIEPSVGLDDQEGLFGFYITPMLAPEGIHQLAYGPHFYADVYPFVLSYDPTPRDFTVDEIAFRDYTEGILGAIDNAAFSLGNVPTILGEFGTYFNFGGIDKSASQDFIVSANIIENYYEVLDDYMINRSIWCYSYENTPYWGEGWNREDFSILGSDQEPRAVEAYNRVSPRFTSGRPIYYHYNSPLDYYEPREGVPTPVREFELEMEGLESSAPTEIFVPAWQFPDGFYVYITDGRCRFDPERQILYWYPYDNDPYVTHHIRIRPPYENYGDQGWDYYFNGDQVLEGGQS